MPNQLSAEIDATVWQLEPDGFDVAVDVSPLPVIAKPRLSRSRRVTETADLSAFSTSAWTRSILISHESDLPPVGVCWGPFLSGPEIQFLREIEREIAELPEQLRHSPSAAHCLRFAEGTGLLIATLPEVSAAVFEDDGGAVALTAHYPLTKRQLSLEFQPDGRTIVVVTIDEHMRRAQRQIEAERSEDLTGIVRWLSDES